MLPACAYPPHPAALGLCYLYYTVEKNGVRPRKGDKHDPASLLEHDCLPRLIDALLSEKPPLEFPVSSAAFISKERQEAETFLGYHPDELRKHWTSKDSRCQVTTGTQEYKVGV